MICSKNFLQAIDSIMNDRILDIAIPIQYKEILLIPITKNILKLFETSRIKFQITIKNNRLILESPEIFHSLDFLDKPQLQDDVNVQ